MIYDSKSYFKKFSFSYFRTIKRTMWNFRYQKKRSGFTTRQVRVFFLLFIFIFTCSIDCWKKKYFIGFYSCQNLDIWDILISCFFHDLRYPYSIQISLANRIDMTWSCFIFYYQKKKSVIWYLIFFLIPMKMISVSH